MSIEKNDMNSGGVLAIIPARGGSKGVVQKNIRDLCRKPLIYYQINNALASKLVDHVVIVTDDLLIAKIAKDMFVDKIEIIMRPPEISSDESKTEDAIIYVLDQLQDKGVNFNIVVTLEPTNPLNTSEYVDECIKKILKENYDSVCCVTEDYGFFLGSEEKLKQLLKRPMRQNIKPRMRETGNCWATKVKILRKEKNRLGGRIGFVKIPFHDSYHLDTEHDWQIIEALLRARIPEEQERYFKIRQPADIAPDYEEKYWGRVVDPDGVIRDRMQEREKRIKECKEEIDYINNLKPGRILDVGCGLGFLLSAINNDWKKHGVEISSFATERAKEYGKIFCGTLKEANYESNLFDVVILYHVIEHMNDPLEELLEVRRILKPYGKVIVGTPDFECGLSKRFGNNFRLLHDSGHIRLFNTLGLYRLFEDLFFEIEKISYPYFETEHFTKENLLRLFDTSKMSPPFYGNIVTFYGYKK